MRVRVPVPLLGAWALASSLALASCATGSSGPPALAYRLPDPPDVTYTGGDTLRIEISALGQTLALTMNSTAEYSVAFARADDGVEVTLAVSDLEAAVSLPMAPPVSVDEEIVQGRLVLSLDRRGEVTIIESPDVEVAASPFFAGPMIAHSFFPALPGTAVAAGDTWVDTVAFSEGGDTGESAQSSILSYTVLGEAVVDGRSLLEISFEGTQEMRQTMSFQGAEIEQETELRVQGRVLWDLARGLMFERETLSEGTGTVRVALAPMPLPTRVESRSRVRLRAQ